MAKISRDDSPPQAVQACHELILWMIPQLDKFPRLRRFTLGERVESNLLTVLERLTEAAYAKQRRELLRDANVKLAVTRHLWRMGWELRLVSDRSYHHGAELLVGLGRQVGGWYKASPS
jgi:hypothetical protein